MLEFKAKPKTEVLTYILGKYNLSRKNVTIIGASVTDKEFTLSCGTDYNKVNKSM